MLIRVVVQKARARTGWRAVTVTHDKLEHYVGKPQFTKDRIYGTPLCIMPLVYECMLMAGRG